MEELRAAYPVDAHPGHSSELMFGMPSIQTLT